MHRFWSHSRIFVADTQHSLTLAYHILAHLGLDDHTYTHLSARSPRGYYIYPFGLLFSEVEPEILLEVSLDGEILRGQEEQYNQTGYIIHGQIYQARSDIQSIFHIHTPEIVAVSSYSQGLLSLSQWALHFYKKIAYHDYDSLALAPQQGSRIARDLDKKFVMLMRNHGSLTCGRTIHEALFYTYHLQKACETQVMALAMSPSLKDFQIPSEAICEKSVQDLLSFEQDLGYRDWMAWERFFRKKNSD